MIRYKTRDIINILITVLLLIPCQLFARQATQNDCRALELTTITPMSRIGSMAVKINACVSCSTISAAKVNPITHINTVKGRCIALINASSQYVRVFSRRVFILINSLFCVTLINMVVKTMINTWTIHAPPSMFCINSDKNCIMFTLNY